MTLVIGGTSIEVHRLKELEEENQRLKRLVTDQVIDIQIHKEITLKKVVMRKAVRHLQERFWQSQWRLCRLVGLALSSWHYKPQPDPKVIFYNGYASSHRRTAPLGILAGARSTQKERNPY